MFWNNKKVYHYRVQLSSATLNVELSDAAKKCIEEQ